MARRQGLSGTAYVAGMIGAKPPQRWLPLLERRDSHCLRAAACTATGTTGNLSLELQLPQKPKSQDAEALAISALAYVAGDPVLLPRFLALTGIEAQAIRHAAQEPGFLAGVLQFILAHEPTLIDFAGQAEIAPASVGEALKALPTGDDRYLAST